MVLGRFSPWNWICIALVKVCFRHTVQTKLVDLQELGFRSALHRITVTSYSISKCRESAKLKQ